MAARSRPRRIAPGASILSPLPTVPGYIASALVPARAGLSDARATAQMADDMRQAGAREGGITRDGLALLGWSAAQIDRLANAARERAHALAVSSL